MNKRLALARAVYPDREWHIEDGVGVLGWSINPVECVTFDPENNADQFCDVQAWLFALPGNNRVDGDGVFFVVGSDWWEKNFIPHPDGTASGIRRAVVQAAERCV